MATVTLTTANNNLSYTLAYDNKITHLRDASFSSYLTNAEESFILKLSQSSQNLPSPTITTPEELLHQMTLARKKSADGEISVFGAEKYFNDGILEEEKPSIAEMGARKHQPMKPKTKMGTPSASSEVSYNSQSALLHSFLKEPSPRRHNRHNKVYGKRFFASLGFICSCSDKKSVDIDENEEKNKNSSNEVAQETQGSVGLVELKQTQPESWFKEDTRVRLSREDCFAFPILNSKVGNLTVKSRVDEEEIARKSLEVFGSSLEKTLTTLTWDTNTRVVEEIPAATSGTRAGINGDGNNSDSSSDLFEIESLSGKGHPYFSRQESNGGMSSCYEPSEASIEWSVVTASAVNFSGASEYGEQIPPEMDFPSTKTGTTTRNTIRRPGISLGCRSHKSVNVAGDAYRISDKTKANSQRHDYFRAPAPARYHQAKMKVIDFESPHAQRAFGTRSVSMSRSQLTRASPPIYMH